MGRKRKLENGLELEWVTTASGKRVQLPVGADKSAIQTDGRTKYLFTIEKGDKIVEHYSHGLSMKAISEIRGMPPVAIIYNWMKNRRDFAMKMKEARALRGIYFEERGIEIAEETVGSSSEEVAAARLKVETMKWAAEVNNPDVYGKKTKLVGDPSAPIAFIIDTGIRREDLKDIEIDAEPSTPTKASPVENNGD
jgi:hypothetical protein